MSTTENLEAEFLAKVTTGTTHEIRNVLAIINESAGLLDDWVDAAEQGRALKPDRLKRSIERITAQVERGAGLMTALNRMAHGLDLPIERVNLFQEASQVALLSARLARQKNQTVSALQAEAAVECDANRLRLEMALFTGVECCLEQLPEQGVLVMHSGRHEGTPAVDFECRVGEDFELRSPHSAACWSRLNEVVNVLNATIETEGVSCYFRISIHDHATK